MYVNIVILLLIYNVMPKPNNFLTKQEFSNLVFENIHVSINPILIKSFTCRSLASQSL